MRFTVKQEAASVEVVVELLKTKCRPMPILLYGLDACLVARQLRSLNHVVVSCARKIFNVS